MDPEALQTIVYSVGKDNGYEKNFGCIHKREISINNVTKNLVGHDELIKNIMFDKRRPNDYIFSFS